MNEKKEETIQITDGAGGRAMDRLIGDHVLKNFTNSRAGNIGLEELDDGATIEPCPEGTLVLTTDSHVVNPLFFPGGDIGQLAVCGTVNDLAVMGAVPVALTSSLIIEEGFATKKLDRVLKSMEEASTEAGVPIITGDTKVLEKGNMDGLAINTAGIGIAKQPISDAGMNPGDKVILTGSVGDHGMALMQYREGLSFKTELTSDIAPLNELLQAAANAGEITAMKDPTRGGIATVLNEMAGKSGLGITIKEEAIPVKEAVSGIAGLIGVSPYEVANEGKAVIAATEETADDILKELKKHPLGKDASIIGKVGEDWPERVIMETEIGGRRFLEEPLGDPIPRIC